MCMYAPQTGGCDDCFPDPNFPVDDDEDFTRSGLTVAVYDGLLFGLRFSDSRRTVYDTITSTDTNKTANTLTTTGSLFKCNFCLINSDNVCSPPLKHPRYQYYRFEQKYYRSLWNILRIVHT